LHPKEEIFFLKMILFLEAAMGKFAKNDNHW
jgi:hypothetical protein